MIYLEVIIIIILCEASIALQIYAETSLQHSIMALQGMSPGLPIPVMTNSSETPIVAPATLLGSSCLE